MKKSYKGLYRPTNPKKYVGDDILHAAVWKKNDEHMVYNYVYEDSKTGWSYVKRFTITAAIKDRIYSLTKNEDQSKVLYLTANPNSEAEVVGIDLDMRSKARIKNLKYDFSILDIKSKNSKGNILTKYKIRKIQQFSKGESTLGGKKVWLDESVGRLNFESRGLFLGEFDSNNMLLCVKKNGTYSLLPIDLNIRFKLDEISVIEKFSSDSIISCLYYDSVTKTNYIKRFQIETTTQNKEFPFLNDGRGTKLLLVTSKINSIFKFNYHSKSGSKKTKTIDVDSFVLVKGWKAIGNKVNPYKRMSAFEVIEGQEKEVVQDEQVGSDIENNKDGDTLNLFE